MKNIYLAGAVRTPIGRFGGTLAGLTPADLGVIVARESLKRAGLEPGDVQEVVWACARQAGAGPNVGRQIAYRAGVPETVPASTVNQACGSGLKAIILGAQEIMLGRARAVLAGGVESMSRVPFFAEGVRWGLRMGDAPLVDGMYRDGFLDPLSGLVMGETAENLARRYEITREEQDAYALRSQQEAKRAQDAGVFAEEIVPVEVKTRKGSKLVERDDHLRPDTTLEILAKLPTAFSKDGFVTAGNASGIVDGAAALVIAGEEFVRSRGAKPLGRLVSWAYAGVEPDIMGIGPVPAIRKALEKANLKLADIDLVEVNEAFACQYLAVEKELGLDRSKTNVNGGAIALGHPLGASGTRIMLTALLELHRRGGRYGLASACIGGGQGIAIIFERV
jgi:acetyl-CoA acetyltransferase family protein